MYSQKYTQRQMPTPLVKTIDRCQCPPPPESRVDETLVPPASAGYFLPLPIGGRLWSVSARPLRQASAFVPNWSSSAFARFTMRCASSMISCRRMVRSPVRGYSSAVGASCAVSIGKAFHTGDVSIARTAPNARNRQGRGLGDSLVDLASTVPSPQLVLAVRSLQVPGRSR